MYCPKCDQSYGPADSRCPQCSGWLKTKKTSDGGAPVAKAAPAKAPVSRPAVSEQPAPTAWGAAPATSWGQPEPVAAPAPALGSGWNSPGPVTPAALGDGWKTPTPAPVSSSLGGWGSPATPAPDLASSWGGSGLGGVSMPPAPVFVEPSSSESGWLTSQAPAAEPEVQLELPDFTQPVDMGTQWDDGAKGSAKLASLMVGGLVVCVLGFCGYVYRQNQQAHPQIPVVASSAKKAPDTMVGDELFKGAKKKFNNHNFAGAAGDMQLAADFFKDLPGARQKESVKLAKEYSLKEAGSLLDQARNTLAKNERNVAIGLAEQSAAIYKKYQRMEQLHQAKSLIASAQAVGGRKTEEVPEPVAPSEPVEQPDLNEDPSGPVKHSSASHSSSSSAPPPAVVAEQPKRAAQSQQPVYHPKNTSSSSAPLGQQNAPPGMYKR